MASTIKPSLGTSGTMHLSDLEPISGRQSRSFSSPKKKRKKPHLLGHTSPLMNQTMLNQLKARLTNADSPKLRVCPPTLTITPPSREASFEAYTLPPLSLNPDTLTKALKKFNSEDGVKSRPTDLLAPDDWREGVEFHSTEVLASDDGRGEVEFHPFDAKKKKKKRRKRVKKSNTELEETDRDSKPTVGSDMDGVHNETEDTPQENIPQENIPQEATPQEATLETTLESRKENRQLPEFPMDPDLQIESVATHPPTATPLNPNGPMVLLSEDDVVEEVEDKDVLTGPPYKLPSLPHTSLSKDLIFVERRDGRGFMVRKRGVTKKESSPPNWDYEITSVDIALWIHKFLQRVALIVHGFIAGISLWEGIVVNVLSQQTNSHINVLEFYHSLALPSHALHFLFLSLIFLSLLDRFDFSQTDTLKLCLSGLIKSPSQIVLLAVWILLLLALLITVGLAAIDERIALYPQMAVLLWPNLFTPVNTTVTTDYLQSAFNRPSPSEEDIVYIPNFESNDRINSFLVLTVVRAICCSLSWLAILWVSSYDKLEDYLENVIEDYVSSHDEV